jgi:hypothetical protein
MIENVPFRTVIATPDTSETISEATGSVHDHGQNEKQGKFHKQLLFIDLETCRFRGPILRERFRNVRQWPSPDSPEFCKLHSPK